MKNRAVEIRSKTATSKSRNGRQRLSRLYEADETAWLEESSRLIRSGRHDKLDYENLASYLDDMAKRDRREIRSRLMILLAHLLKRDYQSEKQSRSWEVTIINQRAELQSELTATLRQHAEEVLDKAYASAIKLAAAQTGLPKDTFPDKCPFTLDQILADE
jgi:undecaprenyl pyrophosphate synthase